LPFSRRWRFLGGGTAHSVAAAKPNIVLILTDDPGAA